MSPLFRSFGLACLVATGLALQSCSSTNDSAAPASSSATAPAADASTGASASTSETRTIVDHTGEEVTIPAHIERVAVDQIPIASTYLAFFDGKAPGLIGMSADVVDSLRNTAAEKISPELFDVDTSYYDNGELNAESLLAIKPDVVFYNAQNTKHGQLLKQAGIPAVGFTTMGDPSETYADWLRLLEDVFNEPGKMDEKISYGAKMVADAKQRAGRAKDKEDVMVIMKAAPGKVVPASGKKGWFTNEWADAFNFRNVTEDVNQDSAPVNAEQILAWNPSTILVMGRGLSGMTAQPVKDNSLEGVDLSGVSAVETGKVYTSELGMWNWFTPNPDAPLVSYWLGSTLYPEQYSDIDLVKMTQEYYKKMYGYDVSEAEAQHIIDPDKYPQP